MREQCARAVTYKTRGLMEDSASAFRRAVELDPEDSSIRSAYLATLNYLDSASASLIRDEHKRLGAFYPTPRTPTPHHNDAPPRKLRLGYVSPDLHAHSVGFFVGPLLTHCDRERFDITIYSDTVGTDQLTEQLRQTKHRWRDTHRLTDHQLNAQIRQDHVDILIELAGHTTGNRLNVMALRPRHFKSSYLGYPASTGLNAIDYRISDFTADPVQNEDVDEPLIRLRRGFLCFTPVCSRPNPTPPPFESAGCITFGSFNNLLKISATAVRLWSQVLRAVPHSRLLLKSSLAIDPSAKTPARTIRRRIDRPLANPLRTPPGKPPRTPRLLHRRRHRPRYLPLQRRNHILRSHDDGRSRDIP